VNLGDWLLWLVYFFFMVIYFMMIFRVIGDLFSRDDLGGWGKAGWILVLLFVPLLTMLIYVISQGPKMAQRSMSRYGSTRDQQADYMRSMTGNDPSTQIKQAHDLLQSGAITQAEFDAIKAKALV
jgi:Short C-terminal domain/Phospholipase_D-nuclease N-terminal